MPDPIITVQVRGMMTRTEVYKLLILQLRNIHEKIGALCTGTDSLIHVLQISYFPTEVIERSTKKEHSTRIQRCALLLVDYKRTCNFHCRKRKILKNTAETKSAL